MESAIEFMKYNNILKLKLKKFGKSDRFFMSFRSPKGKMQTLHTSADFDKSIPLEDLFVQPATANTVVDGEQVSITIKNKFTLCSGVVDTSAEVLEIG